MDIRLLDRLFILGLLILLVQLLLLCSVEEGSSEEAVERKALGQNEFLLEIEAEVKSSPRRDQLQQLQWNTTVLQNHSPNEPWIPSIKTNFLLTHLKKGLSYWSYYLLEEVEAVFLRTWTIVERFGKKPKNWHAEKKNFPRRLVWISGFQKCLKSWPILTCFSIYCYIHRFYFYRLATFKFNK